MARPRVDCISKGKARAPYEFGVKVGVASTLRGNLIVGARAYHGNPYDGYTLSEQLEQATILMQDSHAKPQTAFVDLGYRGVDADNPGVHIVHRGKSKRISVQDQKLLRRRQAIKPIIGHLKSDHRMGRCHLKGKAGDSVHAVPGAAGYNIGWLLRQIAKKGGALSGAAFFASASGGKAGTKVATCAVLTAQARARRISSGHGFGLEMNKSGATRYSENG